LAIASRIANRSSTRVELKLFRYKPFCQLLSLTY